MNYTHAYSHSVLQTATLLLLLFGSAAAANANDTMAYHKMKTLVPIMARYVPIQKLALLPFDKQPDSVYRVFELQYISGEAYGTGYRVVAYRNDRYVDGYDDASRRYMPDEPFNVTENGLHRHVQTKLENVQLENRDGTFTVERRGDEVFVHIVPHGGWHPGPNSFFIRRFVFRNASAFCAWSRHYELNMTINLTTGAMKSEWKNGNVAVGLERANESVTRK